MPPRLRPPSVDPMAADSSPGMEASRNNAMPFITFGSRGHSTNASAARSRICATLCTPFLEDEDRIGIRRSGCMNTLCVRFGILVPFLVSVTFAASIFWYRAEIQSGLIPQGISRWSSATNLDGAVSEGEPGYGTIFGSDDTLAPEPAADDGADEATGGTTYAGTVIPEAEGDAMGSGPSTIAQSDNAPPTMPSKGEPEAITAGCAGEPEPSNNTTMENKASPVEVDEIAEGEAEAESESYGIYGGESNPEPGIEGKDGKAEAWDTDADDAVPEAGADEPEAEAEADALPEAEAGTAAEAEAEAVAEAETVVGVSRSSQSSNIPSTMPEAEPEALEAAAEPVSQTPKAARKTAPVPRRGLVSKSGRSSESNALWEDPSSESEPAFFEINDTVSCFVGNMGLVFGLIYAFVFGRSYSRFDSMMSTFYGEVAAMHKLVLLVQTVQLPEEAVQNMFEFLKNYANQCRYEVVSGIMLSDSEDAEVMTQLYAIVPALRCLFRRQGDQLSMASAELNGAIMEVMLSTIGDLCNLRYERWNLAKKAIPFILWVLIVMNAMLMFFGVLLMQSGW